MITFIAVLAGTLALLGAAALALIRSGIAADDTAPSLRTPPTSRTTAITRRLTGLYADPPDRPAAS